jgi:hypothetical protein
MTSVNNGPGDIPAADPKSTPAMKKGTDSTMQDFNAVQCINSIILAFPMNVCSYLSLIEILSPPG